MIENTFKNKRILLVCKETYSYPLYFLAQKWNKDNKVAAFFFNPPETKYAKCTLNEITYYAFKEIEGIQLYTSNEIADQFTKTLNSNKIVNVDYLNMIDREYSQFQNVNNQIMSTQFLTRHYHYRNYMHNCTYVQQLNWLILNYQNILSIIEEFRPDVVLDTDNAELARTVMREVCYAKKIPYVTLDHPRFELYKLFTHNLGLRYSDLFYNAYSDLYHRSGNTLEYGMNYVNQFREKEQIMHFMYKNDITAQYKPAPVLESIKKVLYMGKHFWRQEHTDDNKIIKKNNPILYPNSWEYFKFYFNFEYRKQRLLRHNKYFQEPEDVKYVYMPLHLIPESTTFSVSPMYVNELTIIEAVSKSLPAGWWLYVKEHQAMVGERGVEFYEKANKLPNVKMVQLNYYQDPKPWIVKSQGVVTISGTSAYEAALLGKHAIVFSDVAFSLIEGIERLHSFEELPSALAKFKEPLDNIRSCAAYIESVKKLGYSINLKKLLNDGEKILRGTMEMDDEYKDNLSNLESLLIDGYHDYFLEKEKKL